MPNENVPTTYLAKLNQLAITEGRAHGFYLAWAERTTDPELERVMRIVTVREMEHSWVLKKRIAELGFEFEDGPCPQCDEWLELFSSHATDLEKFHGFGFRDTDKFPADDFADLLDNLTRAPETSDGTRSLCR